MLRSIQQFFEQHMLREADSARREDTEHALRLATAALLVETTRADYEVTDQERRSVARNVRRAFELEEAEAEELMALAREEVDKSTSLYQFTHLIDQHFSAEKKARVLELMWRVAYADGSLDKYEEHLVRRVADLLHVSHAAFIRTKHRVADSIR